MVSAALFAAHARIQCEKLCLPRAGGPGELAQRGWPSACAYGAHTCSPRCCSVAWAEKELTHLPCRERLRERRAAAAALSSSGLRRCWHV